MEREANAIARVPTYAVQKSSGSKRGFISLPGYRENELENHAKNHVISNTCLK